MKIIYPMLISVLLLSCTSKETDIKEAGVTGARHQLENELKAEIAKTVSGKPHLQATALRVLGEKAAFEVKGFESQGEDATVAVEVQTEPEKVKEALIDIMAKLEDKKEDRFNVPDAIRLIHEKMKVPDGAYSIRNYSMRLHHKGDWEVVHEVKK